MPTVPFEHWVHLSPVKVETRPGGEENPPSRGKKADEFDWIVN